MSAFREAGGIVGDVRGLASSGMRALRTRLELLSIELSEEKAWAVRFTLVAVGALHLVTLGLLLGVGAIVLSADEANRITILAGCAAVLLAAGLGGAAYILLAVRKRHPVFQHTIAVLAGDERALRGAAAGAGDD